MRNRLFYAAAFVTLTLQVVLAPAQQLTIQDESGKQTVLTRADIETLPRVKVTAGAPNSSVTFEAVVTAHDLFCARVDRSARC